MEKKVFSSRRDFLKSGALATVAATGLTAGMSTRPVHAAEDNTLKVGLVGCGARGRGALQNVLNVDPNVKIVALGDAFKTNATKTLEAFRANPKIAEKLAMDEESCFDGLECYKKVVDACDVVLLCEPPGFRPISLRYAIEQGKHAFAEKPVAVDGAGIKSVIETAKLAQEKKLNILSGLCWRYDLNVKEGMERILAGEIGEIRSSKVSYLTNRLWTRAKVEGDTEMMTQVRNWINYTWLSGDFNVEQAIHSIDKMMWSFGDTPPVSCYSVGGRMARIDQPSYGDIYDTMGAYYDFGEGKTGLVFCRQMNKCYNEVIDLFTGTTGYAKTANGGFGGVTIYPNGKEPAVIKNPSRMYDEEHKAFFAAIRSGGETYLNNAELMANSTMAAIMGRLACYTGKQLSWDEAINMECPCTPDGYTWESNPPTLPDENGRYKVEVPGEGLVYHQVTR